MGGKESSTPLIAVTPAAPHRTGVHPVAHINYSVVIDQAHFDITVSDALGELEYGLLFALVACGSGADGRQLRAELARRTGRRISAGACYTALERMEQKDLVSSWLGESTPARGGRRRREYQLEPAGARVLLDAHGRLTAAAEGLLPALRRYTTQPAR